MFKLEKTEKEVKGENDWTKNWEGDKEKGEEERDRRCVRERERDSERASAGAGSLAVVPSWFNFIFPAEFGI